MDSRVAQQGVAGLQLFPCRRCHQGAAAGGQRLVALGEGAHPALVGREGGGVVGVRGQFAGQDVRADQGNARTLTGQERGGMRGVAHEGHAPARPGRQVDLADDVEEEVVSVPHCLHQTRQVPGPLREAHGDQFALGPGSRKASRGGTSRVKVRKPWTRSAGVCA